MMPDDMDHTDRELRARFERLREEERASAGAFGAATRGLGQRRPLHGRRLRIAATLAAAAAILVAVLALPDRPSRAIPEPIGHATAQSRPGAIEPLSFALGSVRRTPLQLAWRTPTDVLLETPGRALLRDIPRLGVSSLSWLAGSAARPHRAQPSADSTTPRVANPGSST